MVLLTFDNQCHPRKGGSLELGAPDAIPCSLRWRHRPSVPGSSFQVISFSARLEDHVYPWAAEMLLVDCLEFVRQRSTKVRQGHPCGGFRHSDKDEDSRTEHAHPLTAGYLSDHLGAHLHTGARLVSPCRKRSQVVWQSLVSVTWKK